jgi:hypothetical protein
MAISAARRIGTRCKQHQPGVDNSRSRAVTNRRGSLPVTPGTGLSVQADMQRCLLYPLLTTSLAWGAWLGGGCTQNDDHPVAGKPDPAPSVAMIGMRRLTIREYNQTLHDLLDDDTAPGTMLLPEDHLTPFDNDYTAQHPSSVLIEATETLAHEVASRAMANSNVRDANSRRKP